MMDSIILYGKPVGFLVICCHTFLSWERKVWKMARSNYTDASLMLLPCVFFCSSPLKVEKKFCYPQLYITEKWWVQTCWCCAAPLVDCLLINPSGLFFVALGKGSGQFYSSLRWSSTPWSRHVVMTLFAPEWQVHQHVLVNVSNERQWRLCSPHSPLGLLTACWLILSFLMSVNSALPHEESVSSRCCRAHLSFCGSPWHMPKLEPEVVFHFSQKRLCGFFPRHLLIFPRVSLSLLLFLVILILSDWDLTGREDRA